MNKQKLNLEQLATNGPASQALHELNENLASLPLVETSKRAMIDDTHQVSKRRRTSLCMNDLLSSVETVEQYVSFPLIQWGFDDDDSDLESDCSENSSINSLPCSDGDEDDEICMSIRRPGSSSSLREQARKRKLSRSKANTTSLSSLAVAR